jgi:hypothetical protein
VKSPTISSRSWTRGLLALLILVALIRVTWRLDAKNLWWDESLSLQRAESDWPTLVTGRIVMSDGQNEVVTLDQHPFIYFGLLGAFVRLVGEREFSLRFPSVVAVVLLGFRPPSESSRRRPTFHGHVGGTARCR